MSTKRRLVSSDRPYLFNPVTRRPQCRWCGKDVPPPKQTFCGPACVHEYLLRSDPRYLRAEVFKRDKGVCAVCKLDTVALERELYELTREQRLARLQALGIPKHRDSYWDADHIVPVVEGGGLCGLDNLRTLCVPCHFARKRREATDEGPNDGRTNAEDRVPGDGVPEVVSPTEQGRHHTPTHPSLLGSRTGGGS